MMADAIEAHPKLMRTVNDAEVLAGSETLVIARRRNPALIVADRGVAGDIEEGQAAFTRVRPIRSRDAEYFRAPVLPNVGALTDVPHAGETVRGVVEFIGAETVCVTDSGEVHGRIARSRPAIAQAITTSRAQTEHAGYIGLHVAIAREHVQLLGEIVVDLEVHVLPVHLLAGGIEIVIREPGPVRGREKGLNFLSDRTDLVGGNLVPGERRASRAVCITHPPADRRWER